MNSANLALAEQLVNRQYVQQGAQARHARESLFASLLAQRRVPTTGWDETSIELLLHELAGMDSNNFLGNVGVGEREGRVICPLVARRHYRFAHGIGRSGDIAEVQPKAAGSSLLYKLTNALVLDLMRRSGARSLGQALVLPLATGMSIALVLLALRKLRPSGTHVLWLRIDQKSCLKAILAVGLVPVVVEGKLVGDQIETDMDALALHLRQLGPPSVLCVLSTTSCFAPRAADRVLPVARLCQLEGVPHVVNNAYGLQSRALMRELDAAAQNGRVDAVVQSTDKNLLVPVGGAIVASFRTGPGAAHSKELFRAVCATYPGRASISPIVDVLVTLLHLGAEGYDRLLAQREQNMAQLTELVGRVARAHGERLLLSPGNPISLGVTLTLGLGCRPVERQVLAPPAAEPALQPPLPLDRLDAAVRSLGLEPPGPEPGPEPPRRAASGPAQSSRAARAGDGLETAAPAAPLGPAPPPAPPPASPRLYARVSSESSELSAFGAKLFTRMCSGARVVLPGGEMTIEGLTLQGFGAHTREYPTAYFTVAAGLGQRPEEIETFARRLDAVFREFRAKQLESASVQPSAEPPPNGCHRPIPQRRPSSGQPAP